MYGIGDFTITEPNYHGLLLNFADSEVSATVFEKQEKFFLTSMSYSDAEGNLQMYSDGCSLYDENGTIFENGFQINQNFGCTGPTGSGYAADQGMIVLPTSDEDIVVLFSNEEYLALDSNMEGSLGRIRLRMSIVDILSLIHI